MLTYENPIIPGFYPDPSVCRVGKDYYLVNSSFEFFPGVPLWHSEDLVHWEQQGYILTRDSQLPLQNCGTSGGIYAPTIRYHNGRYYMITTNMGGGGNFFVWTDDIHGEWSEPIWVAQGGIDPSLFWDDDGKVYYIGTHQDENNVRGIGQFEIDIETGAKLSDTKIIWCGNGGMHPEGPHMYKIGDWYYLMLAEGGTEYNHQVTIARSRSVWGPFESCPHNPILTHARLEATYNPFHAVGHADLVTDIKGNWWMVMHAIRPSIHQLHHIGRETMLAPVTWGEDGWPIVNEGKPIERQMTVEGEGVATVQKNFYDDFSAPTLHPRWSFLRNPERANYSFGTEGAVLKGGKDELDTPLARPTFLGARQQQFDQRFEVELKLSEGDGYAGSTIFHTNEHHYDLRVSREGTGCKVQLYRRAADMFVLSEAVVIEDTDTVILRIDSNKRTYTFYAGKDAEHLALIGTGSSQLLSTEVTVSTFTGCFMGIYAVGDVTAAFRYFTICDQE